MAMTLFSIDRRTFLTAAANASTVGVDAALSKPSGEGESDFDFFFGRWSVVHKRLKERLVGDTRWETFAGRCETRPILGGLGNIDDNVLELPAGTYRAASIRQFDPAERLWAIWWMDARRPGLDPPVRGRFLGGVGTFYGDDTLRGQPIRARFTWSEITPISARWDQAFSSDGGATWETNWLMHFTRTSA